MDCPRRAEDREFFRDRYAQARLDAARAVERAVLGHDVGVNGYTTVAQADELVDHLELDDRSLLLDLGAGRGWPGVWLVRRSGCRAVLSDIPLDGLRDSREYTASGGVQARVRPVCAEGSRLPFGDRSFDAVAHADVFC